MMTKLRDDEDTVARTIDFERFGSRGSGWVIAGGALLVILSFLVIAPLIWVALDTHLGVHGRPVMAGEEYSGFLDVYTAAYLVSIAPLLLGIIVAAALRVGESRPSTPTLLVLVVLACVQIGFITAAWGDQYTGRAISEDLLQAGVNSWAHEAIERAWYVGYVAIAGVIASAAVAHARPRRQQPPFFVTGLALSVVLPWLLISGPYLLTA